MRAWGIAAALTLFVGASALGCSNAPGASCAPACGAGATCCDVGGSARCMSTLVDAHNCGGCGIDCGGGTCALGHCMAGTDSGVRSDGGHDAAASGNCHPSCASGLQCCGTICVSSVGIATGDGRTDFSFMNCHTCGTACTASSASRCGLPHGTTSGSPQCLCGDLPACLSGFECQLNAGSYSCINMLTDPRHCGTPPVACMSGEACMAGTCTCMAASARCPTGQLCTATGCVDTMTDIHNCGSVGNACRAGESCNMGVCQCGTSARCPGPSFMMGCGQTCCGGSCVYVDDYNCGACGTACTMPQFCVHNPFGPNPHCGTEGLAAVACDATPFDAAPGPDGGVTDAATDDAATTDADVDGGTDAATTDAGNDAWM